jgi:phage-related protein
MVQGKCCNIDSAKNSNGKQLADEFLVDLDVRIQVKFRAIFQALLDSDKGFIPNKEKMEKLKGGSEIWELKAKISGIGNYRVFCFRKGNTWFLTNGFHKKTDKTPRSEIDRAVSIRDIYFR